MNASLSDDKICPRAMDFIPKLAALLKAENPDVNDTDRMLIAAFSIARIIADHVGDEYVPITFNQWAVDFKTGFFPIGRAQRPDGSGKLRKVDTAMKLC